MASTRGKYRKERARRKARDAARNVILCDDALRAQKDFAWFCEYVTRNSPEPCKPAQHHLEWHQHLITNQDSKCLIKIAGANIDLLAPRGSAKSTVLGLFVAWSLGIHTLAKKRLQMLYISYSLNAARAKSATIKAIIESEEYKSIFPCVQKGSKWSDEYWSIDYRAAGIKSSGTEEFTMICAGSAGSITSKRTNLILIDDAIKSSDQIATENVREKMVRNWATVIRPTLLEGGRVICLGTRFRPDDLHVTTFIPEKGWIQIEQRAIIEINGKLQSYWESMWSLEYLLALQKDDPTAFMYQYMNIVQRISELGLNPEWIHFTDLPDSFDSYYIGLDLASSLKQKADYTVLMLLGKKGNEYYFIDYRRGKWLGNIEKCDALLSLYDEWAEPGIPFTVFVESVAYQASFKGDFTEYVVNQKEIFDITCVPAVMKGDKLAHLMSVTGIYANSIVKYNRYVFHPECAPVKELTDFGSVPHDDAMDASVLALQGAGARRKLIGV